MGTAGGDEHPPAPPHRKGMSWLWGRCGTFHPLQTLSTKSAIAIYVVRKKETSIKPLHPFFFCVFPIPVQTSPNHTLLPTMAFAGGLWFPKQEPTFLHPVARSHQLPAAEWVLQCHRPTSSLHPATQLLSFPPPSQLKQAKRPIQTLILSMHM